MGGRIRGGGHPLSRHRRQSGLARLDQRLVTDLIGQVVEHGHRILDDPVLGGAHAVQQPPGQAQLADQLGAIPQMLVHALGAGQIVGALDGVQAVHRHGGVDPRHVLRGVPDMRLTEPAHGHDRAPRRQDVLRVEVPVHHHRAEPPQCGVLQGRLPPGQQRRWHPPGPGGVVHETQPAVADLLSVVDRHARLGDHGGGQLVQLAQGAAHAGGQAGARMQGGDVDRPPLEMAAHLDVRLLAAQGSGYTRHVEGQAAVIHDPADAAQHLGLGVQTRPGGVVVGLQDLPVAAPGVDHADDVQGLGLLLGQGQPCGVQPGYGDARQSGQRQRRPLAAARRGDGQRGYGGGGRFRRRR